jgi:hypothetical protein
VETFKQARQRLLAELAGMGFRTSAHDLKRPWAEPQDKSFRLWFHAQAVYLNQHSLFIDMRGMSASELLTEVGCAQAGN